MRTGPQALQADASLKKIGPINNAGFTGQICILRAFADAGFAGWMGPFAHIYLLYCCGGFGVSHSMLLYTTDYFVLRIRFLTKVLESGL